MLFCVFGVSSPLCVSVGSIRGEESLLSVVVDLRQASLAIVRFIAEALLLLEVFITLFCLIGLHNYVIVQSGN